MIYVMLKKESKDDNFSKQMNIILCNIVTTKYSNDKCGKAVERAIIMSHYLINSSIHQYADNIGDFNAKSWYSLHVQI